MTRFLLVLVAHGLDLLTFMWVVSVYSIDGEWNTLARTAVAAGGIGLLILLKSAGSLALGLISHMRPWALIPAAGAGLLGASVNLLALTH